MRRCSEEKSERLTINRSKYKLKLLGLHEVGLNIGSSRRLGILELRRHLWLEVERSTDLILVTLCNSR